MTGLVGYGSSDEEGSVDEDRRLQLKSHPPLSVSGGQRLSDNTRNKPQKAPAEDGSARSSEAHSGNPFRGMSPESSALSGSSSPYVNYRATIRSLTLPTMPNLDVPQSPNGSPTLPIPSADQKISHFLELKKQGIHFNTKLASSSALRNPSLLPKLMSFAGVGDEWQYTTTLPTELWDPVGFPAWAYREALVEVQYGHVKKEKEGERIKHQRASIGFVAAGTPE